ncbi:MAG: AI-2E family transporter [Paludibacteraceae bacterium]
MFVLSEFVFYQRNNVLNSGKMYNSFSPHKQYKYILLLLTIVIGLILLKQFTPYFGGFLGAFTLYVVLRGQMKYLTGEKRMKPALAAIIIVLEALFIFLIPIVGITALAVNVVSGVQIDLDAAKEAITNLLTNLEGRFNFKIFSFESLSFIPKLGSNLVQILAVNFYSLIMNIFIVLIVLYFMFYNYKEFETVIWELLPFSGRNKKIFIKETTSIIKANAIGIPLLAIVQGVVALVGYQLLGVPNALLYGVLTAFATIIPVVGTGIVYFPLALLFLVQKDYHLAVGVLLYGLIVISNIDNIIRLLLQKQLADIHPLITLFGVLIGIPMFGFWGIIFGPLILSLFILFINMYRHDYIFGSVAKPYVTDSDKKQHKKWFSGLKNIKLKR